MTLSLTEKSKLVSSFWKDRPSACPKHEIPMRTFFVERVYKPQVVMVCPKGEMFRFDQKPKQIEFSRPHVKTMALDAQPRPSSRPSGASSSLFQARRRSSAAMAPAPPSGKRDA